MNIALDVGTHWVRSLRRDGDRLAARGSRSIFAVVDDHPAQRRLLDQLSIPFALCGDRLLLPGSSADEFSGMVSLEIRQIFSAPAQLPVDPISRQTLALLIDALLPPAPGADAVCCFSLSSSRSPRTADAAIDGIAQLVRLRGYRPIYLPGAMALILAELSADRFTGIACVGGASGVEASVSHCGREIASCTLPQGGRWIDEQLARQTEAYVLDAAGGKRVDCEGRRRWKEELSQTLLRPLTPHERLLAGYCRELAAGIVKLLGEQMAGTPAVARLPQPLPVVCGGGLVSAPGFAEILRQEFDRSPLPVAISTVRAAGDPAHDITRGCLIHAEIESATIRVAADRSAAA